MSFLAPLFLVGLSAIAIPILIHLIQRERKRVIQFPSLMFLQRIPYQSVRRRRIRHWLLLAMRAAALALLVLAFARPFLPQGAVAAAALGGAREVVIMLDNSASMGYGDHWDKAKTATRRVVDGLAANDRGTLILFGRNAEERVRATSDRAGLIAAVNAAKVTSDGTRYGPALKLAESILSRSSLKRREAVLVSDFQKIGWGSAEDARFPDGMTLTTESVAAGDTTNINVPSVQFGRTAFSGQERIVVTAGVTNRADAPARDVPVTLTVDGREIEAKKTTVAAHASASVTFAPFTVGDTNVRGTVKAGTDLLPADNTFNFVASQSEPVSVLIVDGGGGGTVSLYLEKALAIGTTPTFQTEIVPAGRVAPAMLDKRSVVVLNDTAVPSSIGGGTLKRFLERGGGVLVVTGDRSAWLTEDADLLPGKLGPAVDRTSARSATLGYLDYSHPVFEIFKAARSGDFSSTHVFRYRTLDITQGSAGTRGSAGSGGSGGSRGAGSSSGSGVDPVSRVLARYDDGAVAAAERRTGAGRLIVWTSMLDDSSADLAVKPIFLPLVHQLVQYLSRYEQTSAWMTVGQVLDLNQTSARIRGDRIIMTPAGQRTTERANGPALLELNEQGVYEVRPAAAVNGRPQAIAVNLDPAESDLSPLDPRELVATVTGRASRDAMQPAGETAVLAKDEAEKRQGLWWYLLFAGFLLLAAETAVGNYLSRKEKFL